MRRKGKTGFLLGVFLLFLIFVTVTFFWEKRTNLYGLHILSSAEDINLEMANIDDLNEFYDKIGSFKNVKTVDFGNNAFLYEDYKKLLQDYPNLQFNIIYKYKIYGILFDSNVQTLNLSSVMVDNNLKNYLCYMTNVKNVVVKTSSLTKDEQLDLLNIFPNINFLWDVDVNGQNYESSIEELDLSNTKINDLDDFYLSLKLLPNLKKLDLSDCNLSNETMAKIREDFPNIKVVWRIYFGVWSTKTDVISFSVLITNFVYVRLKNKDIEVFKYFTDLKALDLGHQGITDIESIAEMLPDLEILILADNKLTNINGIEKLTKLKYLELFMNDITDLTPLEQNKNLIDLNICYNPHLSDITPLLNFPRLERLWLVHDDISSESYDLLEQTYPNITFVHTGAGSTASGWRTHERYYEMIKMYYNVYYMSEAFSKYDTN